MIRVLRNAVYRHGQLFITAAWLYTLSFVFTNYFSTSSSPGKVAAKLETYIAKQENRFEDILKDKGKIRAIISDKPSQTKKELVNGNLGIFVYVLNDIGNPVQIYWNTNSMSVSNEDLQRPDGSYKVADQNGIFELMKHTIYEKNRRYIIAGVIPLHRDYFIETQYLKKQFAGHPEMGDYYVISNDAQGTPVKNSKGNVLFRIKEKTNISTDQPGTFSIILRVVSILILIIFINSLATELVIAKGFLKGFLFLLGIVIPLRLLTYHSPFPFDLRGFELFDPTIYASSSLHRSLGDLLVNSVLLYWIVNFIKVNYVRLLSDETRLPAWLRNIISVLCLSALPLCTFEFAGIISSLVTDSKISFDVTNFFDLYPYTLLCFVIICFLTFAFLHLSHSLVKLSLQSAFNLYWRLIIVAATGLFLLSIQITSVSVSINITILAWLLVFFILLEYRRQDVKFSVLNTSFFIFWSIFLMASITTLIIYQNKTKELEIRRRIAENQDLLTDPSGEILLRNSITNFSNAFLVENFSRFYSEYTNKFIKDSLINENFSGYLNKYDTRIYTYDVDYKPLYNEDSTSYNIIKSIVTNQGKNTSAPDLYYYENASDRFGYIYERKVLTNDSLPQALGYIFVVVNPKANKTEALSPELFRQSRDVFSDFNSGYAIAIYNKQHLVKTLNDYNFSDTISKEHIPRFEYDINDKNGFNELWYNAGNNKVIIIVRKNDWFIESLTLFAYLFCLFIATAALLHFGNLLFQTHFRRKNLKRIFHFDIRTQIQATIIAISIFSFIVIGIATISFFIIRFDKNNRDKLTQTAQVMVNEIQERIKSQLVIDDALNLNDIGLNKDFDRKIVQIADIHNIDINFYDVEGTLEFSSQPDIYNKKILSTKMHPDAYSALHYDHSIRVIQKEYIGNFSFMSIYVPVKDEKAGLFAYLNVPYLNSENDLHQEISNFLVTLINLNALIFVLAGALALLVTSRITSSFSLIGSKMKDISLGKMNEEIEWRSNDEIGVLVTEYNKMVQKLEASAKALARSEREGAWREMARQVAHEIKNPLTPMKLSIQHLQRAIDNNAPNVKDLSQQVANTLIEQIEQLSKIAGDFSQFANIGNVETDKFDITEVLSSLIYLYSSDNKLNIEWTKEEGNYKINADKTQLTRLFTNLIKNAVEASANDEKINIKIHQSNYENKVVIAIKDEGTGIPENMKQKIFTPNFTTKSSGTGLGLAICKGIVEKANGAIWFETEEGKGSVFYVSLPNVNHSGSF